MSPTISGGLMRRTLSIEDFESVDNPEENEPVEVSALPRPPLMHRSESLPCFPPEDKEDEAEKADKQGRKAISEDELASLPVSAPATASVNHLWPAADLVPYGSPLAQPKTLASLASVALPRLPPLAPSAHARRHIVLHLLLPPFRPHVPPPARARPRGAWREC